MQFICHWYLVFKQNIFSFILKLYFEIIEFLFPTSNSSHPFLLYFKVIASSPSCLFLSFCKNFFISWSFIYQKWVLIPGQIKLCFGSRLLCLYKVRYSRVFSDSNMNFRIEFQLLQRTKGRFWLELHWIFKHICRVDIFTMLILSIYVHKMYFIFPLSFLSLSI